MIHWIQEKPFKRFLVAVLHHRYITLAMALSLLMISIGVVASGRIDFSFMPKIEAERVTAMVEMPFGTPIERTRKVREYLLETAQKIIDENGGDKIIKGIYALVGETPLARVWWMWALI